MRVGTCKNCRITKGMASKNLCHSCYKSKENRQRFRILNTRTDLVKPQEGFKFEPTEEKPGTLAKSEVISRRLAAGYPMNHPGDYKHTLKNDTKKGWYPELETKCEVFSDGTKKPIEEQQARKAIPKSGSKEDA